MQLVKKNTLFVRERPTYIYKIYQLIIAHEIGVLRLLFLLALLRRTLVKFLP